MRTSHAALMRLAEKGAVNLGPVERLASSALGWRLTRFGFKRRGVMRGLALIGAGAWLLRRGVTGHCPAYARLGVVLDPERPRRLWESPVSVGASIVIHRPRSEVYAFWRDPEQLAGALAELDAAGTADERESLWSLRLPGGAERCWTGRLIDDQPGALIAWETAEPSDIQLEGSVHFFDRAGGRETFVLVDCTWYAPFGVLGGGARRWVKRALRRVKARLEAGEVPISRAVSARRNPALASPRAAFFEESREADSSSDAVEEAGLQSFPASDPPAFHAGPGRSETPSTERAR